MARRKKRARLRRSPRWVLGIVLVLVLGCVLAINGVASSEIVSETGAEAQGDTEHVPPGITEGGSILDPTGPGSGSRELPAKTVALTFDDGPDPKWTPEVLAVLNHYDIDATFFTVGAHMASHPGLVRDILASGSEIGIHTFTHVNLTQISNTRVQQELTMSQLALAGAAGVTSNLIRPPYSAGPDSVDDENYALIERLRKQGYVTVLSDVDSQDWQTRLSVRQMVDNATPADGKGGTILFHDAGGDRSKTIAALNRLIPRLKAEGYTFTTVTKAAALPPATAVVDTGAQMRGKVVLASVAGSTIFVDVLHWLLIGVGALILIRLALMVLVARRHNRRRNDPAFSWGPPVTEPVSVIVPAYNEHECIADTINSLLASDHPLEIIVVDDGSTDDTAAIAESFTDPRVRVIRQPNSGKSAALNTGIAHARHEIIVMMDGDTIFEPGTVRALVQPFATPDVGGVAGNAKIVNRTSLIARWQHVEYVVGFAIDRRVYDTLRCMPTVPGAVGAFRRAALLEVGGVSDDTLAEDTDLTIAVGRAGWRVVYEPRARGWTEAPTRLGQLWLQRYRWCYGTMQSMWKHRVALRERGASGRLGRLGLLHLALFQVLLPLLAPLVDLFLIYGLLFLDPLTTVVLWLTVVTVQMLVAAYALHMDGERLRTLWLVPLQQLVYRQLMYLVLIESVLTAIGGNRLRWHKLHRTGGLQAALASAAPSKTPTRA
jgi:cellulose synthase/poly-beta-1,6-N-acetylglucosamine synthase-like glycosyltransferase/peptidoglycan/xylan/chitin deacetylase (PgdA/CDA1 family)